MSADTPKPREIKVDLPTVIQSMVNMTRDSNAGMMKVTYGDCPDPGDDLMIVVVRGAEEIVDVKKALDEVDEMWANLDDEAVSS